MSVRGGRNVIGKLFFACCNSWAVCTLALVIGECALLFVIIKKVPYTEIDYSTYLEQAAMVTESKVYDYRALRGEQGPLVYPAGHVWLYALVGKYAGGSILRAQYLFGLVYVLDALVVARIYAKTLSKKAFPPVLLACLALSKRAHSVFVLRLFNDGPCAFLSHVAVLLLSSGWDGWACVVFSLAVSVKMSALLYAPAWYLVLAAKRGHVGAWGYVSICAAVQGLVGLPFLLADPMAYATRAFDLGRGFKHYWSVNFKWVPCAPLPPSLVTDLADCEGPFASTAFKAASLGLHAVLLVVLAHRTWLKHRGGFVGFFLDPRRRGAFAAGSQKKG